MRYYKTIVNGYIESVSTANGDGQGGIPEAEYNEILSVIHNKPAATETTDYRLREDLTWEAYRIDPPDPGTEEVDAEEIAAAIQEAMT